MAIKQVRRAYTLDERLIDRFESLVPPGRRSQALQEALAKRVEAMEADALRKEIHEGLAYMADVYDETASEWQHVDQEAWPKP